MIGAWWKGSQYELVIPLRPEDCADRLRPLLQPALSLTNDRPLRGRVTTASFSLCRNDPKYRNSFASFASGRWEPEGARTRVVMRVGVNQVVMLFMGVWLGFVCLGGLAILVGVATGHMPPPAGLVPVLMAAFGVGMVKFGTGLGLDDEAFLIATLEQALRVSARRIEA